MAQELNQSEGLNLKIWLNNNNLGKLYSKFQKADLTIQDVMSNKEDTLKELFHYIGCNPIEKAKLITAIKSLSGAVINQTTNIVFLGDKEQEVMKILDKKSKIVSNNMKQIQDAINGLERSAVDCNKVIHSGCNELISTIENYRKVLLVNVQNMKTKRKDELEMQLKDWRELNQNIMKSVGQCQQIASSKIDDKYSKMKQVIDQIATEQKNDIDVNDIDTGNIQLEIERNDKLFRTGLEQGLMVKFANHKIELMRFDIDLKTMFNMLNGTEFIKSHTADNHECKISGNLQNNELFLQFWGDLYHDKKYKLSTLRPSRNSDSHFVCQLSHNWGLAQFSFFVDNKSHSVSKIYEFNFRHNSLSEWIKKKNGSRGKEIPKHINLDIIGRIIIGTWCKRNNDKAICCINKKDHKHSIEFKGKLAHNKKYDIEHLTKSSNWSISDAYFGMEHRWGISTFHIFGTKIDDKYIMIEVNQTDWSNIMWYKLD